MSTDGWVLPKCQQTVGYFRNEKLHLSKIERMKVGDKARQGKTKDKARQDKTRQDKTRQGKARQGKIIQGKAKQDNTT